MVHKIGEHINIKQDAHKIMIILEHIPLTAKAHFAAARENSVCICLDVTVCQPDANYIWDALFNSALDEIYVRGSEVTVVTLLPRKRRL